MMTDTEKIPEGWIKRYLGEISIIWTWKWPWKDLFSGDYEVWGANWIIGRKSEYLEKEWVIFTGRVWTLGNIFLSTKPFWPSDNVLTIKPYPLICDTKFLYFLLKTKRLWSLNTGSTQPLITQTALSKVEIRLPPISEQKAIADVLSSFDDKIELLRKQNETLEKTASTLFFEWFGKYRINDELPEGWAFGKLTDIATFLNGLALQRFPPESEKECLPVIKIRELKAGITEQSDKASKNIDPKYVIKAGDVLFSWSWSLEVGIWHHQPWALNQHLFKVSSEKYPKWFYYFWIRHHLSWFQEIAAHKATTMGHIQRGHLDMATVVIPDSNSLSKYGNVIEPLFEKTLLNALEIQRLGSIRDVLLPKLMSGGIRTN